MKPTGIIIHHSATKDSGTVSWSAIRRYHKETMGWDDIGYHFGIELVGDQYEILLGRKWDRVGAHTIGMNDKALGVCVVGNYDTDIATPTLLATLDSLIILLQSTFDIPSRFIWGHCKYAPKSCPGKTIMDWLEKRG